MWGSRNGYGDLCQAGQAVVVAVDEAGALEEAKRAYPHTTTVYRLTKPDPPFYLEAPHDFDNWNEQQAIAHANYIYPLFRDKWREHDWQGYEPDYYTVLNEPFAEQDNIHVYLAYERTLIDLAFLDGFKICMLNLAGGTTGNLDMWKEIVVPHIRYGATKGAAYGRHAYGGDLYPLDGNTGRPFQEAEYLLNEGINAGIIITELGYAGGYQYDASVIENQLPPYDEKMKEYPNIIGGALWTLGDWFAANWQNSSQWVANYCRQNPATEWQPPNVSPPDPTPPPTNKPDISEIMALLDHAEQDIKQAKQLLADLECGEPEPTPPPDGEEFYGIDLSSNNVLSQAKWDDLVQNKNVRFVILRLMFGMTPDTRFAEHYQNANARGLVIMVYGFPVDTIDPIAQADRFIQELAKWTVAGVVSNDVEVWNNTLISFDSYKQYVDRIRTVRQHQTTYTRANIYNNLSDTDTLGNSLWVADYVYKHLPVLWELPRAPLIPLAWGDTWHLWQVTDTDFDGNGSLDINRFNGSWQDFLNWLQYEPPPPPPSGDEIDLLPYFNPPPEVQYMVRHPDGSQERFRTEYDANGTWFYVKNTLWENWLLRDDLICLASDISPAPDSAGTERYYIVYENGLYGASWCKRYMRIGETYNAPHRVQFHAKDNCRELDQNSGDSANTNTLIAHFASMTWNGITVEDVIQIGKDGGEMHWFARGYGRVAWTSDWGMSAISEIVTNQAPMPRDIIPCMGV